MMKEAQHALLCRGAVGAWVARVGGAGVPAAFILLWLYLLVLVVLEYQVLEYYYSYTASYLARYLARYVYGTYICTRVLEYYVGTKYFQPTSRSSHSTTYYEPRSSCKS